MSDVSSAYLQGHRDGRTAATQTKIDREAAELIVLALVDQDPSVTVELPAPRVDDADYTKGYVKGWRTRIISRSRELIE
jgi:hypothetical protein